MPQDKTMVPWEDVSPNEIWNFRQNHPELVVHDIMLAFQLPDSAAEKIRNILRNRGVNKWLWARRLLIDLKHRMKPKLSNMKSITPDDFRIVYEEMQNICKMSRYVLWGGHAHKNMSQNDSEVTVKEWREE